MRISDSCLDECPDLAQALLALRQGGMSLRVIEAASGERLVRCAPAEWITDEVRCGLRRHGDLVRQVLALWGDGYGLDLLCLLWAGGLPGVPFALRRGVRVTGGARFIRELRRVAISGPKHPRAYTGAFQEDVAALAGMQPAACAV